MNSIDPFGHLKWWTGLPAQGWPLLLEQYGERETTVGWQYLVGYYLPVRSMAAQWEKVLRFDPTAERAGPPLLLVRRVVIESPYAGDVARNLRYLDRCMKDSIGRGEAPFASHKLYPSVLDDGVPDRRELGLRLGFEWRKVAEETVVYTDLGVSPGMEEGVAEARVLGQRVTYREIGEG